MGHTLLADTITKFQESNNVTNGSKDGGSSELKSTIVELNGRVQYLESLLCEVAKVGTALKKQNVGDSNVMKLAEKLASIETNDKENGQVN
jgi:hypothetical protein